MGRTQMDLTWFKDFYDQLGLDVPFDKWVRSVLTQQLQTISENRKLQDPEFIKNLTRDQLIRIQEGSQ